MFNFITHLSIADTSHCVCVVLDEGLTFAQYGRDFRSENYKYSLQDGHAEVKVKFTIFRVFITKNNSFFPSFDYIKVLQLKFPVFSLQKYYSLYS